MPPPSVDTASVVHADGERPGRRREAAPHAWPASAEQAGGGGGGGAAPSGGARPPRPQTRTLWGRVESRSVAFVGMFFVTLTAASLYSLLAPFFPSVAAKRGVPPGAIGFVFASFSLVVFVSSPFFGVHMARLGQRNTLFCGLACLSAATVGFGLMERVGSGAVFFAYCITMRVFQGLGSAAVETASYAIAATLFPDNVTAVLGVLEVANGLGYVVGPPLGGVLYHVSPMLPFLVVGLSPIPVLVALMHLLPRTLGEGAEHSDWSKLRAVASRRGVALVCAAAVLGEGSFAFVEPVLEPFLLPLTTASVFVQTHAGGHHGGVGLIYAVVSVVYSGVVPFVGLAARRDRLGTRSVMVLGLAAIAFGFLLLGPSPLLAWALPGPSLLGVAAGMAFLGLGQSAALVPNMACLMEVCDDMPDQEATTNVLAGVLNAAYSAGSMLAPVASSLLSTRLPFRWCTTLWAAALAAMAAALQAAWEPGKGGGGGGPGGAGGGDAAGGGGCGPGGGGGGGGGGSAAASPGRAAGAGGAAGGGGGGGGGGEAAGGADGKPDARGQARRRRVRQLAGLALTAAFLLVVYYGQLFVTLYGLHAHYAGGVLNALPYSEAQQRALARRAAAAGGGAGFGAGGADAVAVSFGLRPHRRSPAPLGGGGGGAAFALGGGAAAAASGGGGGGGGGASDQAQRLLATSSSTAAYYNALLDAGAALKTSSSSSSAEEEGGGGAAAAQQQQQQQETQQQQAEPAAGAAGAAQPAEAGGGGAGDGGGGAAAAAAAPPPPPPPHPPPGLAARVAAGAAAAAAAAAGGHGAGGGGGEHAAAAAAAAAAARGADRDRDVAGLGLGRSALAARVIAVVARAAAEARRRRRRAAR